VGRVFVTNRGVARSAREKLVSSPPPYGPPGGGAGWDPLPVHVSVTDAVARAFEHTKRMLFPFDIGKWLTLGFVAFLADLGEGGGSSFNLPDTSRARGSAFDPVIEWVRDNVGLVLALGAGVVIIGFAIGVALVWVSSRGKLMFVDCVVNDRAAVREPWARFAGLGNRLFWVRFWLSLIGLGGLLLAAGVGLAIAWPDLSLLSFGPAALGGLVVGISLLLLVALPLWAVGAVLEDFVVPAMVLHRESVKPAWLRVKTQIFAGHAGDIVVFYLMKIGLSIGVGLLALLITCITCCIAAVPYLGSVILLPFSVFLRSYSIFYIQQFGADWQLVREPEPAPY
jgi:hypothetical protein